MKNFRLKVFCDFDGTITRNDVWLNSLARFMEDKEAFNKICNDFNERKLNTRECNTELMKLVRNFDFEKFNEYLDGEEIDITFDGFVKFCREHNHEIRILSGGLDYYIEYILKRENIEVDFFSCRMGWDEESDRPECIFVHTDEYCSNCETCKRNLLVNNQNDFDDEISVYIGDGVSDFCVSGYADIVFAKGKLASHCWKNNITYFEYKNFDDVKNKLLKLMTAGKIRQRQEAKIRRRNVFMGG